MSDKQFDDLDNYARADLAGTHKSTAGSQQPVDPHIIDGYLAQIETQGYVILPELVPADLMSRIKAELSGHLVHPGGRNNFEGFKTSRLYSVINTTLSCNQFVEHPLILGLLDRLFMPNYLLSQLQVIDIHPGEAQQPIHFDDAFYPVPRPRAALGAATIWAVDDFTADNGATVVIPGSHRWGPQPPTTETLKQQIPVVMPAGSAVFFLGTLWHGGGGNTSASSRMAITAQYCEPWCRQQENFSLSIPLSRVKQCSEHIKRMLGYSIHSPFMGFVNGVHPKRLLENSAENPGGGT